MLYTRAGWEDGTDFNLSSIEGDWIINRVAGQPATGDTSIILATLFTHNADGVLKITAFTAPLRASEALVMTLDLYRTTDASTLDALGATWSATTSHLLSQNCTMEPGWWGCTFRVEGLALPVGSHVYPFRVRYTPLPDTAPHVHYSRDGRVPAPVPDPRVLTMGCFGPTPTDLFALAPAVLSDPSGPPDIVVLQGDQTYRHTEILAGFLHLVRAIADLTANRPTIVQMDDHDYGLGNLYGAGTADSTSNVQDSGDGFTYPCEMALLERLFMSHNPDVARPDYALTNQMRSWFTSYDYGEDISFAIVEARKFKSKYDGDALVYGATQEAWLQEWCNGASSNGRTRIVLSQTTQVGLATRRSILNLNYCDLVGCDFTGRQQTVSPSPHCGSPARTEDAQLCNQYYEQGAFGYNVLCKHDGTNCYADRPLMVDTFANADLQTHDGTGFRSYMNILEECNVDAILSGDQHLSIAVQYPEFGNITECVSPAAVNSVFYRVNDNPVGGVYRETNGETDYKPSGFGTPTSTLWKSKHPTGIQRWLTYRSSNSAQMAS